MDFEDLIEELKEKPLILAGIGLGILIILSGLFLFVSGPGQAQIVLTLTDSENNALSGTLVEVVLGAKTETLTTDSSGKIVFNAPLKTEILVKASREGFQELQKTITADRQKIEETLILLAKPTNVEKT